MTSSEINQITSTRADFGTLTLADGRQIEFIDLHLGYLQGGTHHTAPVLTMTPDQARSLALALLSAADKAQETGKTSGAPLQ